MASASKLLIYVVFPAVESAWTMHQFTYRQYYVAQLAFKCISIIRSPNQANLELSFTYSIVHCRR